MLGSSIYSQSLFLNEIMSKKSLNQKDVDEIMNVMDKLKIKEKCEGISKNYQLSIEKTINKLPIEKSQKNIFNEISEFLVSREN